VRKKISSQEYGNELKLFAASVTSAIKSNDDGSDQKKQVEKLVALERRFLRSIWRYSKQTKEIYKSFIIMVSIENKNILSARAYFRESAVYFNAYISDAIKEVKLDAFRKFSVNFLMMSYIKHKWRGDFPKECQSLYEEVETARRVIIENNLPLAINKARLHFKKNSRSHLELLDLISIASSALINGVDKYVGKYSRNYNGVLIGRMVGDMIYDTSETEIHFYPSDKHVIYRANSLRNRFKIQDIHTLAKAVNKSFQEDIKEGRKPVRESITASELQRLLMAASMLSLENSYSPSGEDSDGDEGVSISTMLLNTDSEKNTEDEVAKKQAWTKILNSLTDLNLIDRKILRMKGIRI
jgi:DNA-directed RNA polymerase specialized sigma subunit